MQHRQLSSYPGCEEGMLHIHHLGMGGGRLPVHTTRVGSVYQQCYSRGVHPCSLGPPAPSRLSMTELATLTSRLRAQ